MKSLTVFDNHTATVGITQTWTAGGKAGAHLYIIRSDDGMVKIGRSNDPKKRLEGLKGASPYRLRLVHVLRGRGGEERAIHDAARQWRRSGEWFHDTFDFRECVKAALGVEIRFLGEYEEEEGVAKSRLAAELDAAVQRVVWDIHREAEEKAARKAARRST